MDIVIREYIRKLLELGVNIQEGDALIVYMPEEMPDIERIFLEFKDEYKIAEILFVKNDYRKIYDFLATRPTNEEIQQFIGDFSYVRTGRRIKVVNCTSTVEINPYYNKLCTEYAYEFYRYQKIEACNMGELYTQFQNSPQVVAVLPTKAWAYKLYGDENATDELWRLVSQTVPSIDEAKKIIDELQEKTKYLNELGIKSLRISTESGTDLEVGIARQSRWINSFGNHNGGIPMNFPSYEICTAPDMNIAKGKVVLTRPSFLGAYAVTEAELTFNKGQIISCITDNQDWKKFIKQPDRRLNRLGEVALVSSNTPIAMMQQTFYEMQLDENTGSHIALGDFWGPCVDYTQFPKSGKLNPNDIYNKSDLHQDLTIGDNSIYVGAVCQNGGKKVRTLMKNGKWQI